MNDTLATSLKRLRLSGMAQSLDVRLQEAAGNGLNHMEFLELILQGDPGGTTHESAREGGRVQGAQDA